MNFLFSNFPLLVPSVPPHKMSQTEHYEVDDIPFVWTMDTFGTHVPKMDEEHAMLFRYIDRLDANRDMAALEDFAGIIVHHFYHEEEIGISKVHKQAHDDLVKFSVEKMKQVREGHATVDDKMMEYLRRWWKAHILKYDIPTYGKKS